MKIYSLMMFFSLFVLSSCNFQDMRPVPIRDLTPEDQMKPFGPIRTIVAKPGDYGSSMWRIVAMQTADNGDIVLSSDARRFSNADLPAPMDTAVFISKDYGATFNFNGIVNPPCKKEDKFSGYGDPLLIKGSNGTLFLLMAASNGYNASTKNNPISTYITESKDNGKTWSYPPRDITAQLWSGSTNQDNIKGAFVGSGRGICLKYQKCAQKNGRIMAAMLCKNNNNKEFVKAIYSDDNGQNWKMSSKVEAGNCGVNEPTVLELADGTILMNIRPSGGTGKHRNFAYSQDGGESWHGFKSISSLPDPSNNGCIVRYTSIKDGYDKNRLLHINALYNKSTTRQNITVSISYNEGTNWTQCKTLCPGIADYSTLTILPDGTIGSYVEEGGDAVGGWTLVFTRFNLYWLTDGKDYYTPPKN